MRSLKVLDVTTLFPSSMQPELGKFVAHRVSALSELCELQVAAGIGRFPVLEYHPRYAKRRLTEKSATYRRAEVRYVRFTSVPRLFKSYDPIALARAIEVKMSEGVLRRPDVVLSELSFPDGAAARRLSRKLGVPFVVTLRGHDINDLPFKSAYYRREIGRVLTDASKVLPVAKALGEMAIRLGCPEQNIEPVYNGVDSGIFGDLKSRRSRLELGVPESCRLVVSVGHLVERKGHELVVAAIDAINRTLPETDLHLAILGGPSEEGDATAAVSTAIARSAFPGRVRLLGSSSQSEIAAWLSAADLLVLASSKEGRPNVVLEALSSGCPVVATRVGGTAELLPTRDYGELCERTVEGLRNSIQESLSRTYDPDLLRRWAGSFTWDASARAVYTALENAAAG